MHRLTRASLTAVNPDIKNSRETEININGAKIVSANARVLTDPDIHAHNSFENPRALMPTNGTVQVQNGAVVYRFPAASVKSNAQPMSAKKQTHSSEAVSKELTVVNKLGIHARPASMFVRTANRFGCEIFVEKDGEKVNGKSIMGLMMLAAGPGSKLTIHAEGDDAAKAVTEIEELLKRKFDED